MASAQLYTEVLKEVFNATMERKKRKNKIIFYRSVAKWTSNVIKKIFATSENINSNFSNIQIHDAPRTKAFAAIESLIQSSYKDLNVFEMRLIETAHEFNASLKGPRSDLMILCAAALGAREYVSILPLMINIACSEEAGRNCQEEIQLLAAIAIEIVKNNGKPCAKKGFQAAKASVDLSLSIDQYLQALKVDPLFPRIHSDQLYLRDHLLNLIGQLLQQSEYYSTAFISRVASSPFNDIAKPYLFAGYKYNSRRTSKQDLILLNHYINEMDIRRIFISYPKSGRTWLRMVLSEINKKKDFKFTHLMANPYFYTSNPGHFVLPSYKKDLAVFLHRDPRDVVVSQYHQVHKRDIPHKESLGEGDAKKLGLSDFVRNTMPPPSSLEDFVFCPHWGFNRIAQFNICVLKNCGIGHIWSYERMSLYPRSTMSDLCNFLALGAKNSTIYKSIDSNSFSNLLKKELAPDAKKSRATGKLYENHDLSDINARKFRKGMVGGWAEEVSPRHHKKLSKMTKNYYISLLEVCPDSMRNQLWIPSDIADLLGNTNSNISQTTGLRNLWTNGA